MRFTLHGALHGDVLIGMDLLSPTPKLHNYTERKKKRTAVIHLNILHDM